MKFRTISAILFTSMMTIVSCQNEELLINDETDASSNFDLVNKLDNNELMNQFGLALSKVTFENQEVREFLKEEAISQFDKNYDILWVKVKDEMIGNKTLRDILVEQTSDAFISQIEEKVPQLNVLFPKIAMFGIEPEKYNSEDNELPVVVPNESCNLVYFDGECEDTIQLGEVPAFNVLVINENSRVIVNNDTKTKGVSKSYSFIDPAFDGTKERIVTKGFENVTTEVDRDILGNRAIQAFNFFNNPEPNNNNSIFLQRDYIYYGLTPSQQNGVIKANTQDYITFIEIDPYAYFKIADQIPGTYQTQKEVYSITQGDAIIKNTNDYGTATISRKKRDFTTEELINELWTKGSYEIKIDVVTSNECLSLYLPVMPQDLWNFNMKRDYVHKTLFRHSKYTYTINPLKFTAKRYVLATPLALGNWDLSKEALERFIYFSEEDLGVENSIEETFEMTYTDTNKFSGNTKIGLGLGEKSNIEMGFSGETTNTNTHKETRKITMKWRQDSDNLGGRGIYFYDPIIQEKTDNNRYVLGSYYNTGYVKFGITAY